MRYLKFLFLGMVSFFAMGSGTVKMKFTEGTEPGYLAPKINLQGVHLKNNSYTLLQFWAAYDAESRVKNIRMYNEIKRLNVENVKMISIAFDEKASIFEETVRTDGLDVLSQFDDYKGEQSDTYKTYQLKKGFTNFLINTEGVIIAKNVDPSKIINILQQQSVL